MRHILKTELEGHAIILIPVLHTQMCFVERTKCIALLLSTASTRAIFSYPIGHRSILDTHKQLLRIRVLVE